MEKVKRCINEIKERNEYKKIIYIIWIILCTFFFSKMVLNFGYVSESVFQTHKDYYLISAVCYFILSVLLLQRIKLQNIWIYIFSLLYGMLALWWLKNNEMNWGEELQNVYKMRWTLGGLLGVSLIDAIRYKKFIKIRERNWISSCIFLIAAVFACVISWGKYYTYILIIPFLLFYILCYSWDDWKQWTFCLTFGYYAAFVYTMIKSFVNVPYIGERYHGIYINHGLFGIFIGGAIICTFWWFYVLLKNKEKIWKKVLCVIAFLFAVLCLLLNGARVAELAVVVTVMVIAVVLGGKREAKQVAYRLLMTFLATLICVVGFVIVLSILNTYEEDSFDAIIENEIIRENVRYWCNRAHTAFNAESKYGLVQEGTLLNAIDRFSSDRISYAIAYLRDANWFGHEHLYIQIGDTPFGHPHNTFIYWIYGLGMFAGIFLFIWIISYAVLTMRYAIKDRGVYIFPFMWVAYFMTAGLNEDILWIYVTAFILLILQYPLLVKIDGKRHAE